MKKTILILITALAAGSIAHTATLYSFGPSTDYTTSGRALEMEDGTTDAIPNDTSRGFNTTDMSPNSTGYTGPEFFGGWEITGSLNQTMDVAPQLANDNSFTGGFDGPIFAMNNTTGTAGSLSLLVMGTATSTDLGDLDTFTIGASRSTGSGNSAGARAVIRIGSSYYVGDDNGNNIGSSYATTSLGISNWFAYNPSTSISSVGSSVTLGSTDQVDAVGFLLTRNVLTTSPSGNVRVGVGEFTATAIPEPSSIMMMALGFASLILLFRKR